MNWYDFVLTLWDSLVTWVTDFLSRAKKVLKDWWTRTQQVIDTWFVRIGQLAQDWFWKGNDYYTGW